MDMMHAFSFRAAILAALALAAAGPASAAGDPALGREVAQTCQVCHGLDGIALLPNAPNLAGQNEQYLIKQLLDYQTGARNDEQMSIIAQGLSDEDIANVAAWYSAIDVAVTMPAQ